MDHSDEGLTTESVSEYFTVAKSETLTICSCTNRWIIIRDYEKTGEGKSEKVEGRCGGFCFGLKGNSTEHFKDYAEPSNYTVPMCAIVCLEVPV